MKSLRWILMLVFTAVILAGVKGGSAKAGGPPCGWEKDENGNPKHNWVDANDGSHENKAPTCTEDGYTWKCCGNQTLHYQWMQEHENDPQYTGWDTWMIEADSPYYGCFREWKQEPIKATGHNWVEDKKDATCAGDGYVQQVCKNCGATKDKKVIPATEHNFVKDTKGSYDATCEKPGMEYTICANCGSEGPSKEIPALGHDFSVKVSTVEPNCLIQGYTVYKCSRCDKTENRDYVPTTGKHNLQESILKKATCTEDGEKQIFCTVCDYNVKETIKATGHNWTKVETVPATCQNQGYTIYKCSNCGATENRDIVPKTDNHDLKESILKQPTCLTDGEKQVYCTVCDYNEKVKIPATGHNWVSEVILKQPTCEEPGEEELKCTKCGTEGPRQAIPATGHDWDEGKVTKEAEVYVEGEITYTCKNDPSHTKVEKIPALPDENGNVTPPDPDGNGNGQDGQNGNGDGQNGQNGQDGNGDGQDGQNGNNGQDGTDGTIGSDGKNPDGTVGNADGSNGNGSGTDKNGNGGNGSGNGNGSSDTNKKSSNLWLILLIIFLLLFGLAAVIILAVRKLKSQRD
ncbi:MAG: collagen-like protein [Lachnospiraceae bacterium]|nr:collagen-like protein [Lachnospiraceae bacterium]